MVNYVLLYVFQQFLLLNQLSPDVSDIVMFSQIRMEADTIFPGEETLADNYLPTKQTFVLPPLF